MLLDANNTSSNHPKSQFARSKKGTLRKCLSPIRKSLNWGKNSEILETIVVHQIENSKFTNTTISTVPSMFSPYEERGGEYKPWISLYKHSLFLRLLTGQHIDLGGVVSKTKKFFPFLPTPNPVYIYYDLYICICRCISSV